MTKFALKLAVLTLATVVCGNVAADPVDLTFCDGPKGKTSVVYSHSGPEGTYIEAASGMKGTDPDALMKQIQACLGNGRPVSLWSIDSGKKRFCPTLIRRRQPDILAQPPTELSDE